MRYCEIDCPTQTAEWITFVVTLPFFKSKEAPRWICYDSSNPANRQYAIAAETELLESVPDHKYARVKQQGEVIQAQPQARPAAPAPTQTTKTGQSVRLVKK